MAGDLLKRIQSLESAESFYLNAFTDTLADTDKIITIKGSGYFTYYDEMIDADAVLAGLLDTRVDVVTALSWIVEPASDDKMHIDQAEWVNDILSNLSQFKNYEEAILGGGLRNGFSVQLVNWELVDGKYAPLELISCSPDYFKFNPLTYELEFKSNELIYTWEPVDPYRFLVLSHRPRYSNPYGVSLLRSLFWLWWFKHYGFMWWMQAAERGAVVTPVGSYDEDATPEEVETLKLACKHFLGNKYIVKMDKHTIDFPAIKTDPTLTEKLISMINEDMRFRVEGSVLASGTSSEGGTRALGQVHDKRSQARMESDAKSVMVVINQLIAWMMELNFAQITDLPKFIIQYELQKEGQEARANLETAAKLNIPISIETAAKELQLPLAKKGEEIIKLSPATPSMFDAVDPDAEEVDEIEELLKKNFPFNLDETS